MGLERARNIADLRALARKRLPAMVFDYIDGGADDEITLKRNVERFRDIELTWDALVDVENIDTSTTIMGRISRKKKNTPAGASSNAVTARECFVSFIYQAALKRAMISARRGLVNVSAAPNSSLERSSAAG